MQPLPQGQVRLGRYTLRQRLGEGGMGIVHLATDDTGRAVALKVLRDHVAADPDARLRLAREVTTLGRVRHPQVAAVLGADVGGERPYLVTRYVPGPPLDEWVRDHGPLSGDHLVRLGRGLADALGAIHAAGVVHRDLKPANVLMVDGSPVVIDFGIAHVADDARLTQTGLVMGTPGYLPPELLDGAAAGESTDWWAWAATLAFAATGRPPFGRGPMDAVFHRVYRGDADLVGVDPRLTAVLLAALDPQPERRPRQQEILAGLGAYAAGGDSGDALPAVGPVTCEVPPPTAPVPAPEPAAGSRGQAGPSGPRGDDPRPPVPHTRSLPRVATRVMPRAQARPPQAPYASFQAPLPHAPQAAPLPEYAPHPEYAPQPGYGGAAAGAYPVGPARRPSVFGAVVGLLCLLVALAVNLPVYAVAAAFAWSVLARTVAASLHGLQLRRAEAGLRGTDIPVTILAAPLRLVPASLSALLHAVFGSLVGVAALVGTAAVLATSRGTSMDPFTETPLAVAMTVAVLVGWWGIGGGALRRGTRATLRSVAPTRWGPAVLAGLLLLGAAYLALRSQATGMVPDFTPLESVISTTESWW